MKNGLLVWNVLLTLLAGYLLFAHLSRKSVKESHSKGSVVDKADTCRESFRIAYFEMDSVEANYSMVKDIKTELARKEDEINNELDRLAKDFNARREYYANLARENKMSQTQSDAATQELMMMDEKNKNRKAELDQEYGVLFSQRKKDVKLEIEKYLKEYNKSKKYSFIASDDPGLFFYRDSTFNITPDLIKGLNEQYKPAKAKKGF